ncbi:DivIVA domain-containing protein [Mycobacterium sp. NPDC051804]|uniref:DivIVA domain-containing protein n=1 Tax=Mycobacterium sp. NPDC051804 TaxID=3364295 RepID=UPI0037A9A58D
MQITGPERGGITPEHVHSVVFSEASRSQGAYHRDEVDAFLVRVEATLRDPGARGGVTEAELRNVAFSEPPFGSFGYNEGEVDLFLDRVKIALSGSLPGRGPDKPVRCLLYPYGGWDDPRIPVRAIDLDKNAVRVIDLASNELIASVSLAEVAAKPGQYSGGANLILVGPGMEAVAITPHARVGVWRKRPKSKKPAYVALEQDWLTLTETFGLTSELADEETPQNIGEHLLLFFSERGSGRNTWRTPLAFGLTVGVPSALYWGHSEWNPIGVGIGVVCLLVAGLAWRFKWEF